MWNELRPQMKKQLLALITIYVLFLLKVRGGCHSILMQLKCSLNLLPTLALRILGHHLQHTCKNALMAIFDLGWL